MASLGELFVELGVVGDTTDAKKVKDAIEKIKDEGAEAVEKMHQLQQQLQKIKFKEGKKIIKDLQDFGSKTSALITAVSGAVFALNKLTDSLVSQNQYWINLTRNSDIALGTFQKWGMVGAALDKSLGMEGAAGAIADLNQRIFELKLTGEGARGFQLAGIMPTNAEDVMEQLRSRVSGMNDTSATYLLKQLGIDPRMLSVLRLTRAEFAALNKEMERYQLSPEQRATIQEFHKQMSIVNVKMQYFKDSILIKIMPYFLNFMRNLEFITSAIVKFGSKINKLTGNWKPLIAIVAVFLTKIKPIAKYLKLFNIAFGGLIAKIPIFGKYMAGLGGIISRAFLPLTAIYLLIDDVRAFLQGGRSGIGYLIALFQHLADVINFETPDWLKNLIYLISKADSLKGVTGGELANGMVRTMTSFPTLIPDVAHSIVNNNQNQSKQFIQNNTIHTSQTSQAVMNEVSFMNAYFNG